MSVTRGSADITAGKNCFNCAHRNEPPTFENCADCIEPELKGWEPAPPPKMKEPHGELLEAMPPVELIEKLADIAKMLAELAAVMRDMPKAMAEALRVARESANEESSKKVIDLLKAIEDGDFMDD